MRYLILFFAIFALANEELLPGNVTSGGNSVIIDNGKLTKNSLPSHKEVKTVPCRLKKLEVEVKESSITLKKAKDRCEISYYPKDLKVEIKKDKVEIEGDKFASITLSVKEIKKVELEKGGELYILTPLNKFKVEAKKEASIYLLSTIKELELKYDGELSLQVGKIEKLKVKGKGDLIIIGENEFPIQKEIDGNIIKVKERE